MYLKLEKLIEEYTDNSIKNHKQFKDHFIKEKEETLDTFGFMDDEPLQQLLQKLQEIYTSQIKTPSTSSPRAQATNYMKNMMQKGNHKKVRKELFKDHAYMKDLEEDFKNQKPEPQTDGIDGIQEASYYIAIAKAISQLETFREIEITPNDYRNRRRLTKDFEKKEHTTIRATIYHQLKKDFTTQGIVETIFIQVYDFLKHTYDYDYRREQKYKEKGNDKYTPPSEPNSWKKIPMYLSVRKAQKLLRLRISQRLSKKTI